MTEQMSILELVTNASPLVQLVMAALALASIVSWIMIPNAGSFLIKASDRQMRLRLIFGRVSIFESYMRS